MKDKKYLLILLLILSMLVSCSPRGSFKVLSFFFDGVPDYSKKNTQTHNDSLKTSQPPVLVAALPIKSEPGVLIHAPYQERKCEVCHEKGINNKSLKEQPAMCYSCHKDFKTIYNYVHGPVAGGYCTTCHNPHKGVNPGFVKQQGQPLCLHCHLSGQIMKNPVHKNIGNNDCITCHNPHGGTNRFVLK